MIDYVTLLLLNMAAALVVLAAFLWWGLGREDTRHWAPAFGICGLVAAVGGFAMTFTAPIPKPYSMAYGEMSVLLGVLFLGAAWALARGWNLLPLGIYAFFSGLAAVLIGIRIIHLSLTLAPLMSGAGFILTGLGGVCAGAVLWRRDATALRLLGALVMLAAASLWAFTGCMAYWSHMKVEAPAKTATSWIGPSPTVDATPQWPASLQGLVGNFPLEPEQIDLPVDGIGKDRLHIVEHGLGRVDRVQAGELTESEPPAEPVV